ncbi:MAG: hypothetical protein Q8P50_08135 [Bacillota bacterium]|nr:hypothetical protein [Bacillota bacterium]
MLLERLGSLARRHGLTKQLAVDLQKAGVFTVAVSLDHWRAEEHGRARRHPGAFRTALNAMGILRVWT